MVTVRSAGSVLLTALFILLQGCGSQSESTPQADVPEDTPAALEPGEGSEFPEYAYPPPGIKERVPTGEADWPVLLGNSLADMVAASDTIIVGRAVDVEVGYPLSGFIQSHFGEPGGETPPPGHPKAASNATPDPSGKIGPVGSWYTVEVVQVLSGTVKPGDLITINQFGGVVDGIMHEGLDDPLIRVPATYLFFLDNPKPGTFGGWPFGRFEAGVDGLLQTVKAEMWGGLPAVAELNGLTVNAAVGRIAAAIEQLPASTATPSPHSGLI